MSAYGKSQPPQLHGYDTGRAYAETSYPFAAPQYGSQSSVPSSTTAPVYQMTAIAYPSNQGRTATYDDHSGPYLNVGSTPIPEVTSYAPSRGSRGTKVYVHITSLYELMTANIPTFFLVFGQRRCPGALTKISQQGAVCQYTVTTEVPQFAVTGWSSSQVPIFMLMESGDGELIGKVDVGEFSYLEDVQQGGSNTSIETTRKRKPSSESADLMKSPAKRMSNQNLRPKEEYQTYGYTPTDGAPYSPYLTPNMANLMPQYSRPAGTYQQSSRNLQYGYSTSSTASPTIKAHSPQVASWSPAYSTIHSNIARSPGVPSNAATQPALSSLPSPTPANPPLIRTSTLQQTPSPSSTPHGGHPGHQYNAYSLYPHKAKLDIQGDLDSMALNWTEEEWESKRRLVQFKRSQSGSTITTTFQPVSADERPPNSVCISCIYWEEKEECFVTSVDTIYLLEQLVAARFTVEEKNRIRRNLEGFRPLTVSKGKSDSEEFFKVIMAFPTPKPRNIEKDVKVFHWKDLSSALKKIIGKYSASPSSTLPPAPALLTPVSSTGYTTEGSSTGLPYASDHHGAISPRSISGSTTSTVYTTNIPTRVLSPHSQRPIVLQGGPDLRVSVPQNPHEPSGQWSGSQHHMPSRQQQQQQYQHLGTQSVRNSWDMSPYLDGNPATAVGTSSSPQSLNYQGHGQDQIPRSMSDPSVSVDDNRISGSLSGRHQSHQMPRT